MLPDSLNEVKVKQVGKNGKLLEGENKKTKKKKKKAARSRSGPLASTSSSNPKSDNNTSHIRSRSTGNPPSSSCPVKLQRHQVPVVASETQDQKTPSVSVKT